MVLLSRAFLPFMVICSDLRSSVKLESRYRITGEEHKRESCPTLNSSWGSPQKFRVKPNNYRVALSPVLHADWLGSLQCWLWDCTAKWNGSLTFRWGYGGCTQCVAIKANKGTSCQVLFFQTFLAESVKLIYKGFFLICQLSKFDSFWLSGFKLCDCTVPSVQSWQYTERLCDPKLKLTSQEAQV